MSYTVEDLICHCGDCLQGSQNIKRREDQLRQHVLDRYSYTRAWNIQAGLGLRMKRYWPRLFKRRFYKSNGNGF